MELTLEAAANVDEHRRRLRLPESHGLRIRLSDDRTAFETSFTAGPDAGDEVVSFWGTQVYVAPELTDALRDHALVVDDDAVPARLVLRARERQSV